MFLPQGYFRLFFFFSCSLACSFCIRIQANRANPNEQEEDSLCESSSFLFFRSIQVLCCPLVLWNRSILRSLTFDLPFNNTHPLSHPLPSFSSLQPYPCDQDLSTIAVPFVGCLYIDPSSPTKVVVTEKDISQYYLFPKDQVVAVEALHTNVSSTGTAQMMHRVWSVFSQSIFWFAFFFLFVLQDRGQRCWWKRAGTVRAHSPLVLSDWRNRALHWLIPCPIHSMQTQCERAVLSKDKKGESSWVMGQETKKPERRKQTGTKSRVRFLIPVNFLDIAVLLFSFENCLTLSLFVCGHCLFRRIKRGAIAVVARAFKVSNSASPASSSVSPTNSRS